MSQLEALWRKAANGAGGHPLEGTTDRSKVGDVRSASGHLKGQSLVSLLFSLSLASETVRLGISSAGRREKAKQNSPKKAALFFRDNEQELFPLGTPRVQ